MKIIKLISNFIQSADFFCTTELLRYKSQPQYGSVFGGTVSIIMIVALVVMFYNKFIDCINEVSVSSSTTRIISTNPTPYAISTHQEGNFMLGVEVWNHDLNAPFRYFDIVMTSVEFNTGVRNESSERLPLEPCTTVHWQKFPQALKEFERLQMNRWLCLPFNTTYQLQGKYTSSVSKTLQFAVKKCTNISNPSRPCANQSQIDMFFQTQQHLLLTTYFINPLINPSSQNYLTYYLQDKYYVYFTKKLGNQGVLYMQDFEINTDQSILPFVDQKTESGGLVTEQVLHNIYGVPEDYDVYCSIIIFKFGVTKAYQRGFEKLDQLLSYIGGLFGTISLCLMIVNSYNANSYEIDLASSLFRPEDPMQQNNFKRYNFFSFLLQNLFDFFKNLGLNPKWKSYLEYNNCKKEMEKQLDILYLLERVLFLETAVSTLLDTHQLKALHLRQKLTLNQLKAIRKDFKIKKKVHKVRKNLNHNQKTIQSTQLSGAKLQRFPQQMEGQNQNQIVDGSNIFLQNHNQVHPEILPPLFSSQFRQTNELPQQPEDLLSEISSDNSSQSSRQGGQSQVINQLVRLREEASNGNVMSKKIWQITNKSILQVLPNLLTQNNLIFSALNFTSSSVQKLQSPDLYHHQTQISLPPQSLLPYQLQRHSLPQINPSKPKPRPFKAKSQQKGYQKDQNHNRFKSVNKYLNQAEVNFTQMNIQY